MKTKVWMLLVGGLAGLLLGMWIVTAPAGFAQGPTPRPGTGQMGGMHGQMGGMHGQMGGHEQSLLAVAAETLGMTEADLLAVVKQWVTTHATIMIVDDQPDARALLRGILSKHSYTLLEAVNGQQALELLAQTEPALLILDLMMPEIDGFEVLRQIRASATWRTLPVIIATAKDLDPQEEVWLQEQAQLCLHKSQLSGAEFIEYIRSFLSR